MATDEKQEFENIDDAWAAALQEQQDADAVMETSMTSETTISEPEEKSTQTRPPSHPNRTNSLGMNLLLRISVEVRVRLGETELLVNEMLQLGQGSIVELDKLAGENLDLLVNDNLMGRGEVVVVNDHFGLRIKEIISPHHRIKELG